MTTKMRSLHLGSVVSPLVFDEPTDFKTGFFLAERVSS